MHSSRKSQVKGLEVKQTTLQNEEIAELKKIRDELLQKVQDSFKKAQSMCIAPPLYVIVKYLEQNGGVGSIKGNPNLEDPNYYLEQRSNLEGKLDLEKPDYLFNRRIHLLEYSKEAAQDFLSGKDLRRIKKKYGKIIKRIESDIVFCLDNVSKGIGKSQEKDRLHNESKISKEFTHCARVSQCEMNLAQALYSSQSWGLYNPQANYEGYILASRGKIHRLKRRNHSIRGLDRLRSLEDSFITKLRNNFEQKDLEGLGQEYAQDLETQIEILKKIYSPHQSFNQNVAPTAANILESAFVGKTLNEYQLSCKKDNIEVGDCLEVIRSHITEKRGDFTRYGESIIWKIILLLNPFIAEEIPNFGHSSEPDEEKIFHPETMILALQKTIVLMKEQVIIYDPSSRAFGTLDFILDRALTLIFSYHLGLSWWGKDKSEAGEYLKEQASLALSSVDSIAAPLQDIAQEQLERR